MKNNDETETLIWDYLDGKCSRSEKEFVEEHIEKDPLWKSKFEELSLLHAELLTLEMKTPPAGFSGEVMKAIAEQTGSQSRRKYINEKVVSTIAWFFLCLIGAGIFAAIRQSNVSDSGRLMPAGGFSDIFSSGSTGAVILCMNLILALVVLDKWIAGSAVWRRVKQSTFLVAFTMFVAFWPNI